jgi:hypothetical protein
MDNEARMQQGGGYSQGGGYAAPVSNAPGNLAPTAPVLMKKEKASLFDILFIAVPCLVAVVFVGLFVWAYMGWRESEDNATARTNVAVAEAVAAQKEESMRECAEAAKLPTLEFVGPEDYGALSFLYPRTWSVFVSKDASNGGDFEAFFNPVQVSPVSATSINALRLTIYDRSFETVVRTFDALVRSGKLTATTIEMGGNIWNRYDGEFSSNIIGSAVVIRVRDKTIVLRTDSTVFLPDFENLIQTVRYNV